MLKDRELSIMWQWRVTLNWLTTQLLGLNQLYQRGDIGISELQVLVVRWRFWYALFLTDDSVDAFVSVLAPTVRRTPNSTRRSLFTLLSVAKATMDEAQSFSTPPEEPQVMEVRRKRKAGNDSDDAIKILIPDAPIKRS